MISHDGFSLVGLIKTGPPHQATHPLSKAGISLFYLVKNAMQLTREGCVIDLGVSPVRNLNGFNTTR